jgi:adenylyl-sulfate kinase
MEKFNRKETDTVMQEKGLVVWLTGLSGAGKTTLAGALCQKLSSAGHRVEMLDGDEVRENLSRGLGFSREDRNANVRRIAFVARLLARNGVIVLTSLISPYRESRADARRLVETSGAQFLEVYIRCPLDVLIERDVKGLYEKAIRGEVKNFTGISDPYEEPLTPDLVINSASESVERSAAQVLLRVLEACVRDAGTAPARADLADRIEAEI